jgi:hypothetical protein
MLVPRQDIYIFIPFSIQRRFDMSVGTKKCVACYRLPFLLLPVLGADLRASATAPSPREANRTALRTLRILFPSPPPRLAFFDDESSNFLISAKFALFSASTDFSAGSN